MVSKENLKLETLSNFKEVGGLLVKKNSRAGDDVNQLLKEGAMAESEDSDEDGYFGI